MSCNGSSTPCFSHSHSPSYILFLPLSLYPSRPYTPPVPIPLSSLYPSCPYTPPVLIPLPFLYPSCPYTPPVPIPLPSLYPSRSYTPPVLIPLLSLYPSRPYTPPVHIPLPSLYPSCPFLSSSHIFLFLLLYPPTFSPSSSLPIPYPLPPHFLPPSLLPPLTLSLSLSDLGFRYDWTTVCTVVDVASTGPATQILAPGDRIIKVK